MTTDNWVSHFAERRRDQLIRIPPDYPIHPAFTPLADEEELRAAFARLHALCELIYQGMEENPEVFGLPLYAKEDYRNFSQQCRDAAQAVYRPFILLFNLFTCGETEDCAVSTSAAKFKAVKPRPKSESPVDEKIANLPILFQRLTDCGFVFEGLKNNKVTNMDIIISYPDDALLLRLWKMLADKAKNTDCLLDFLQCSYRLLQDDLYTKGYSDWDRFIDTFPLDTEKAFVNRMDKALLSKGLLRGEPGYYYRTESQIKQKGPYSFRVININKYNPWHSEARPEKAEVGLRIRNVQNCLDYLRTCPSSIQQIFTAASDGGCQKHADGTCKHGVGYRLDGEIYWRCGCCDPAIRFQQPRVEDIPHYIKLVELGEKR